MIIRYKHFDRIGLVLAAQVHELCLISMPVKSIACRVGFQSDVFHTVKVSHDDTMAFMSASLRSMFTLQGSDIVLPKKGYIQYL